MITPKVGEKWEIEFGIINQTSATAEVLAEIKEGKNVPTIQCRIGDEVADISVLCFRRKVE